MKFKMNDINLIGYGESGGGGRGWRANAAVNRSRFPSH